MTKDEQKAKIEGLKAEVEAFLTPSPEGTEEKVLKVTKKRQAEVKLAYAGLQKSIGAEIFSDNLVVLEKLLKWRYGEKVSSPVMTEAEKVDAICGEGNSVAYFRQIEVFGETAEKLEGLKGLLEQNGFVVRSKDYHFHIAENKDAVKAENGKISFIRSLLKAE